MHTPIVGSSIPQRLCIQNLDNQEPRHCLVVCSHGRCYRKCLLQWPAVWQCEKLRVATLHGRLPTSPGSLAHNRLSHSSGTVRNLSLTLPNTSENFKCCTSCSQTLAPFSHTSQTNWPWAKTYPVALNCTKNTQKHIKSLLKVSPHTKNSFKTSDYATSRFQTIKKQNVVLPPGSKSFTNKLKRNLCIANCKHRARWTSRHGISSPPLGHKARNELAGFKPAYSSSMRTDIWHKYLST